MIRRLRVEVTHAEARYALADGGPLQIVHHAGLRLIATAEGRPERFWAVKEIRAPDGPGPGHWP
jgi:hypothetical protein